jgi:hypothetical protein
MSDERWEWTRIPTPNFRDEEEEQRVHPGQNVGRCDRCKRTLPLYTLGEQMPPVCYMCWNEVTWIAVGQPESGQAVHCPW